MKKLYGLKQYYIHKAKVKACCTYISISKKNSTVWILETLLRKSNQQPSHLSPLGLQPHNLPMTHLNVASIGNQWEPGKT